MNEKCEETKPNAIVNGYRNENSSNPNLSNEINAADQEKMKGDAIGDTMYSERFVLKTLLQLVDNVWNEELENDLCTLWDMTTEKDVIHCLLTNNFIELSLDVIQQTKQLRLTEIMVGIIANMCVQSEAAIQVYSAKHFDVFISLVTIDDTPTLIQLLRLYKALLFSECDKHHLLITDNVLHQINFILCSSQNSELLLYTLQVTSEIINKKKYEVLKEVKFLDNANEAFRELIKNEDELDMSITLTQDLEKHVTAYLKVLESINTVLEQITRDDTLVTNIISDECIQGTLSCLETILTLCSNSELIQNITETIEYYIYSSVHFVILVKPPFHQDIFKICLNIFQTIIKKKISFESDVLDELVELLMYMVSIGEFVQIKETLCSYTKDKLKYLFVDNIINKNECDDTFINTVNNLCCTEFNK